MKRIVINLPEKLWKTLKLMAVEKETSVNAIVREGIYLYLLVDECGKGIPQEYIDDECLSKLARELGNMIIVANSKLLETYEEKGYEKEETETEGSED